MTFFIIPEQLDSKTDKIEAADVATAVKVAGKGNFSSKEIYAESTMENSSGGSAKLKSLVGQVKRGLRPNSVATVEATSAMVRLVDAVRNSERKDIVDLLSKNKDIR